VDDQVVQRTSNLNFSYVLALIEHNLNEYARGNLQPLKA
jgi:hypothetical protein